MNLNVFNKSTHESLTFPAQLTVSARREPVVTLDCNSVFAIKCRKVGGMWESEIKVADHTCQHVRKVSGENIAQEAITALRQDIDKLNEMSVFAVRPTSRHAINMSVRTAIEA